MEQSYLEKTDIEIRLFRNLGISVGYGGFCLFLFLQEIGGTKSLMGLSNTVQSVALIPLLIFSDRIFRKLSHPNVQVICAIINSTTREVRLGVSVIRLTGKKITILLSI